MSHPETTFLSVTKPAKKIAHQIARKNEKVAMHWIVTMFDDNHINKIVNRQTHLNRSDKYCWHFLQASKGESSLQK